MSKLCKFHPAVIPAKAGIQNLPHPLLFPLSVDGEGVRGRGATARRGKKKKEELMLLLKVCVKPIIPLFHLLHLFRLLVVYSGFQFPFV